MPIRSDSEKRISLGSKSEVAEHQPKRHVLGSGKDF